VVCSGGTLVTVIGDNMDASAKPIISVTVTVTRLNSTHDNDIDDDHDNTVYTQSTCQSTVGYHLGLPAICFAIGPTRPIRSRFVRHMNSMKFTTFNFYISLNCSVLATNDREINVSA